MFVKENTISAARSYFKDRLQNQFSESELKSMWKQLICKRFEWSDSEFLLSSENRLSESDLLYVRSFVKRLQDNEPFQYILGETTFCGLSILCDSRALIPRPETEELVSWISELTDVNSIIDICSGSGCISLGLKSHFSNAKVSGVDLSEEANNLAETNAIRNKLSVDFYIADALDLNSDFWKNMDSVDLIVSNPPYITLDEKMLMNPNVLDYEPHLALFVPNDSAIIFYERIAKLALQKLNQKGSLFFELNPDFADDVVKMLKNLGFGNIELKNDLQGKKRMLKAQKV
ncbi:MAG: peptide chain release factor N(5)-glutamine methyltransferase [Bacteroidetes bacterium]|nr:peptide chain release factor N(5)-glutamine methyltransferase [Bacteroidota bacterium]